MQAGLVAGITVAAAFFIFDIARGEPLATPLSLSRALLESDLGAERSGILHTVAGYSAGGRLAVFTALHMAVFTVFGMFAAGLSNLFHVPWNARTGAGAGLLVGLAAWLIASRAGPVWMVAAHLTPEIILGAGLLGGGTLGWYLRVCRIDDGQGG